MVNRLASVTQLVFVFTCAISIAKAEYGPYPVSVSASTVRQTFEGFGFSMTTGYIMNKSKYGSVQPEIFRLLAKDLNASVLRLWWTERHPTDPTGDDKDFYDNYVLNNMTTEFRDLGIGTFLFAPAGANSSITTAEAIGIAKFIRQLRQNGTKIDVSLARASKTYLLWSVLCHYFVLVPALRAATMNPQPFCR